MKALSSLIMGVLIVCACSSTKDFSNHKCNENISFKNKFFNNIATIEKYTIEQKTITKRTVTTKHVTKSFQFISRYTKVSNAILGYDFGYTTVELFKADKERWLKWYELNKCSNLH